MTALATWHDRHLEPPNTASDGACIDCGSEGYEDHDGDSGYWCAPEECELCDDPVCGGCMSGHVQGHYEAIFDGPDEALADVVDAAWEVREEGHDHRTDEALLAVIRGAMRAGGVL